MEKKLKYQDEVKMEQSTKDKVEAYARKKYPGLTEKKTLVIREFANIYTVATHKDGSPIILGKGILG